MPNRRKPTAILESNGAYRKNPNRRRPAEPQPIGEIGLPPDRLSESQQQAWHEIVECCAPGVLTNMDRLALEILCHGVAHIWSGEASSTDLDRVHKQLGKFGMTPSERSTVAIQKPEKKSGFGVGKL